MNMITKNSIYDEHLRAWLHAHGDKKARAEIIKHICFVAHVHPKSVARSFKRIQMRRRGETEGRGRKEYFTPDVIIALKEVWSMASEPCAENLHGVVSEYVRILIRDGDWHHSPEATTKLLSMSLGTMKKRIPRFTRHQFATYGRSTTDPSAIHSLIPLRTGPWSEAPVGTMQIDTVAHCGNSQAGSFVFTVNATDVPTLWGVRKAQMNKGQYETVRSMEKMEYGIPFPVVEWHPDSGSEFINWHCKKWCDDKGQRLTRSRPNHKNDNCFVEERNGHIVRRWVGYDRMDTQEIVTALNAVYDVLTPYTNHFVASRRIVSKERIGARWRVRREKQALTPYRRVLVRDDVSEEVKTMLRKEHERLNPRDLQREIHRRLQKVFMMQNHHGLSD